MINSGAAAIQIPLSILMPTYNGSSFLRQQVESIFDQSFTDFELIAIDDGSTDDTRDILAELQDKDKRLRILPSSSNMGQRARLSELVASAAGEFIAFSDQDDIWKRDKIEKLVDAVGSASMAFGRSELIDQHGVEQGRTLLDALKIRPSQSDKLAAIFHPMVSAHAAIVRRKAINPLAFSSNAHFFDHLMGLEAMLGAGLVYVDTAVVYHRMHSFNQTNRLASDELSTKDLILRNARRFLFAQTRDRFHAWSMFDYLSKSPALDPILIGRLENLARHCWQDWYSAARSISPKNDVLLKLMMDSLGDLAGSNDDLHRFEKHATALTRSNLNIRGLANRLHVLFLKRADVCEAEFGYASL